MAHIIERRTNGERRLLGRRRSTRIRGGIAVAALAAVPMLASCSSEDAECNSRLPAPAGMVVVDGRCDSAPEQPVGVYSRPEQVPEFALGRVATGVLLRAVCVAKDQQPRADLTGISDSAWVQFDFGRAVSAGDVALLHPDQQVGGGDVAFIPAVWTDGEEGVADCTAEQLAESGVRSPAARGAPVVPNIPSSPDTRG